MATRDGIGVAGTHGKSTTTALVAHILAVAGRDPTLAGGAHAIDFGGYSRLGHGPELVAEADEFGRRFLELHPGWRSSPASSPTTWTTTAASRRSWRRSSSSWTAWPRTACVVTCEDEPNLAGLPLPRRRVRYGWAGHADWRLDTFAPRPGGGASSSCATRVAIGAATSMRLTGRHNAANAVAALAVADELGVAARRPHGALATFQGTRRRFETVAQAGRRLDRGRLRTPPNSCRCEPDRGTRMCMAGGSWPCSNRIPPIGLRSLLDELR